MPTFRIRLANDEFTSTGECDLPNFSAARRVAIKSALEIGTDELLTGKRFFGAEVTITDEEQTVGRFVVALGAGSLQ